MSVIFHVLRDEEKRLEETVKGYEKLIEALPKGSPRKKKLEMLNIFTSLTGKGSTSKVNTLGF